MLLVRGADSDVVGEDEADALLRVAPRAEALDVAGAGHMVAGDATTSSPPRPWPSS
jgi:hypothetical protein